jgi:hypothetical protein
MSGPPPLPPDARSSGRHTATIIVVIVCLVLLLGAVCIGALVYSGGTSGVTRSFDNMFGDQHLKTTVALLELHKTRYGRYPYSLKELKFVGDWDQIALSAVRYHPAADGSTYYVEVARGWVGRPVLEYPPDFWQGTGYSPVLKPHDE